MRLYATDTRSLVELPEPPAPVRMYFCGPTVYARAHVGNARPYVVGMWLRRWLRGRGGEAPRVERGRVRRGGGAPPRAARARVRGDARPQHHRRERQDLRGRAERERRL